VDLPVKVYLKQDSYIYKEPNEKSQRTWQFKKGTELTIQGTVTEGWIFVVDAEKRKGFVKPDVLSDSRPK
jgi:hypothetical protein